MEDLITSASFVNNDRENPGKIKYIKAILLPRSVPINAAVSPFFRDSSALFSPRCLPTRVVAAIAIPIVGIKEIDSMFNNILKDASEVVLKDDINIPLIKNATCIK